MTLTIAGAARRAVAGLVLCAGLVSGCKTQQPSTVTRSDAVEAGRPRDAVAPADETRQLRQRSRRGRADTTAAPGTFDFYLLNLSWSPEFCATHASSQECGHGLGFVVHGLWPQDNNGGYPENCSNAPGPSNPQSYTDIIPTASLVEHEWQTHGTCSGLAADAYFLQIRKAFAAVRIPTNFNTGTTITPNQLLASFAQANPAYPGGSIALSCGNNRLTAVEVCLTKDLQPESCQGVRSCGANVIRITPQ